MSPATRTGALRVDPVVVRLPRFAGMGQPHSIVAVTTLAKRFEDLLVAPKSTEVAAQVFDLDCGHIEHHLRATGRTTAPAGDRLGVRIFGVEPFLERPEPCECRKGFEPRRRLIAGRSTGCRGPGHCT